MSVAIYCSPYTIDNSPADHSHLSPCAPKPSFSHIEAKKFNAIWHNQIGCSIGKNLIERGSNLFEFLPVVTRRSNNQNLFLLF